MPAQSVKQRRLMAIAENEPSKVSEKNKGVLSMGKKKLHEFAATPEKGLPKRKRKKKKFFDKI